MSMQLVPQFRVLAPLAAGATTADEVASAMDREIGVVQPLLDMSVALGLVAEEVMPYGGWTYALTDKGVELERVYADHKTALYPEGVDDVTWEQTLKDAWERADEDAKALGKRVFTYLERVADMRQGDRMPEPSVPPWVPRMPRIVFLACVGLAAILILAQAWDALGFVIAGGTFFGVLAWFCHPRDE